MEAVVSIGRRMGLAAALVCGVVCVACGGPAPRAAVAETSVEPHWQDIFETTPDLLVVLRPTALRQDKVYGPLLQRALDAARDRSRVVAATRILEVVQQADEVVVGVRAPERGRSEAGETVVVLRGVASSVDPAKVVDSEGRPLWAPGPGGAVRELVRERDEQGRPVDASLFELEDRTWVVAVGDARSRAREVFAHPLGRPEMKVDPDALAMARIDGASVVSRFPALRPLGALAAVGRKLQSVTVSLPPGTNGTVRIALAYVEEDAAAFAEVAARQAIEAIGRKRPENLAWLASAKVDRPDKRVLVTLPLPPRLVDSLLHAGTAPIDFDPGAP